MRKGDPGIVETETDDTDEKAEVSCKVGFSGSGTSSGKIRWPRMATSKAWTAARALAAPVDESKVATQDDSDNG